jgi:hypothetical protein
VVDPAVAGREDGDIGAALVAELADDVAGLVGDPRQQGLAPVAVLGNGGLRS